MDINYSTYMKELMERYQWKDTKTKKIEKDMILMKDLKLGDWGSGVECLIWNCGGEICPCTSSFHIRLNHRGLHIYWPDFDRVMNHMRKEHEHIYTLLYMARGES